MAETSSPILSVPRWIILGSFPNTGAAGLANKLGNEEHMLPSLGERHQGRRWTETAGDIVDLLNPALGFADTQNCFAYAFTYISSPRQQAVDLMAGSDDGIAIWLNGTRVHYNDAFRALTPNQDVVRITLRPGWNALLLKISQGTGGWGFVLELRPRGGTLRFAVKRASTTLKIVGHKPTNRITIASPELPVITVAHQGLFLSFDTEVISDAATAVQGLLLAVKDGLGRTYGSSIVKTLASFSGCEARVTLPAGPLLQAAGLGKALKMTASSRLGEASALIGETALARLFLDLLNGFEIARLEGYFDVPAPFRGQPAVLQVRSEQELSVAGQAIAARPKRADWDVTAHETATGRISLKLRLPANLTDPAARLMFGKAPMRELLQRVRFVATEMGVDAGLAHKAARAGLGALAKSDFGGVETALKHMMKLYSSSLPNRSKHKITLVGHAHIDMNWLWNTAETQQVAHDTFRQVLAFMDEFPQFTFSQSQASTYAMVERLDPRLFEQIRRRIKEGRWEVLGGMVDEGDTNMSGGEALVRSMLIGQRYFLSRFGKRALVGWLPDNFGHVAQLPQILKLAGMFGFYGHRCQPKLGPFLWEGIDGTRVINYITPTYNGDMTPGIRELPEKFDPRNKKMIWVYGVGDHGGGPTRRDITRAIAYNALPGFPEIKFGTAAKFFESLKGDSKRYRVYRGELQYIFEGCYTSISRIKEGNRRCENTLYSAEVLSSLMALRGFRYPTALLQEAWNTLTFNQFHDILCGSAVHESNRESVAAYDVAWQKAQEVRHSALRHLAAQMPTDTGKGQPVVVFNPRPTSRTDIVEADLFAYSTAPGLRIGSWIPTPFPDPQTRTPGAAPIDIGQGPYATIVMKDSRGKSVDAQVVDGKVFPNGYRMKVRFLARNVPACGQQVFYADTERTEMNPDRSVVVKGTTVETPFLRVEVNRRTGHLTRVYDKRRDKDVFPKGAAANALKIYMEKPHGMSAWDIGPISSVITLDKPELVRVTEYGPVRACIEVWRKWSRSIFVQRIYVYRDTPRVEFELEAHWFELSTPTSDAPMLRVSFPLNVRKGRFFCDTPFAAVERPTTGREVPAQKWIDLSNAREGGAALLNDSKYGHRCEGNVMETTLLRASVDPDPYPDQGPHLIRYALLPHAGDWKKGRVMAEGRAFNTPMLALETPPGQKGTLRAEAATMALQPGHMELSGVKKAEDDTSLVIRFHEAEGRSAQAVLALPGPVRKAERVDLLEQPLKGAGRPRVADNTIRLRVKAHEIVTLKVRM